MIFLLLHFRLARLELLFKLEEVDVSLDLKIRTFLKA